MACNGITNVSVEGSEMPIPADFPRRTLGGAVGGAAPKFLARVTAEGGFSAYASDAERQQAYDNAEDLAQQLRTYALRKERENPGWTREFNLNRIRDGIQSKVRSGEWDFSNDEQVWIMTRLDCLLAEHSGPNE